MVGLAPRQRKVFNTRQVPMGRPLVDIDHALRLAGELDVLRAGGSGGNLVNDAHLAALAI